MSNLLPTSLCSSWMLRFFPIQILQRPLLNHQCHNETGYGFKKFVRCGDRVAFVNKTPYMRLYLCCFSVTGSLPPCGSLNSTCLTHLWVSPTLFIFLDKVTLEFLAKLSSDSNLHNLTANNRMPVFENKRVNLQDIWRWILKKCYL